MDKLAPPFVPLDNIVPVASPPLSDIDQSGLSAPFSLSELKGILSSVKDSAPGNDGIPYSFLSHLSDSRLNYYLSLVNYIMITGAVPGRRKT